MKPLSRSFYKMIEMCKLFSIIDELPKNANTFHLAEGPGGFIEAVCHLRNNISDTYYGMTLQNEDVNIPGWKKSSKFLKNNPNVIIENGQDETGNLFNIENFKHCIKKYKGSMDFITGDGGFDFSIDFNNQETLSSKLIFTQICYALSMQKKGGQFILKVFDLFTSFSIDLIFLLCSLYKKVYIVKPHTSRYANSEKYLVCKDFILDDTTNIINKLLPLFDFFINNDGNKLYRLLDIDIPYLFNIKLEEYNAIFGQQQIENILTTLSLIENYKADKIEIFKKHNIAKSIKWCQKHNINYNPTIQNMNIFLNN
jgi:23S rRNA U2552 (ribose-2'-O)-methylase RlmE/FtsJ